MDIWDVLSQECREEVILVECDSLMETLETYLRKHRSVKRFFSVAKTQGVELSKKLSIVSDTWNYYLNSYVPTY